KKVLTFGDDKLQWFLYGWSLVKSDRTEEGIEAYRKTIELDPLYAKAQYNLALALISLENHEEALNILGVCRELEDNSYRVLFNMGICCYALEEYDRSIELYDLALEKKETSAVWNNIGLAYLALGDKKEANSCFKIAKGMK
ncbi:tetratricopeptide repeat protein, partial [bacterium]|nr:tetratricopeptide repeat protein [bacterium]